MSQHESGHAHPAAGPKGAEPGSLLGFVKGFAEPGTLSVEEDLGHGYVRLKITEAERRQALQDIRRAEDVAVELARNARDAGASNILVATRKLGGRWREITVIDDGCGIPKPVQSRIFESRVTSKSGDIRSDRYGIHGRGMALFSIKQTVRRVELLRSEEGRGSIFRASVDLQRMPERSDQHTFPEIVDGPDGISLKGPRNMLRSLLEVGMGHEVSIFIGSPTRILATLCRMSRDYARAEERPARDQGPLWAGLHNVLDGSLLARMARDQLGLEVSQRNALRVIEGTIEPLIPLSLGRVMDSDTGRKEPATASSERRRALSRRITGTDIDALRDCVLKTCNSIGGRYFIEVSECRVRKTEKGLSISVTFEESL